MSDEAKAGLQLSWDKDCSSCHSGAALRRGRAGQGNPTEPVAPIGGKAVLKWKEWKAGDK